MNTTLGGVSDDWQPTPEAAEPAAELVLEQLDLLDELTHPVRGAVVRRLRDPRTVAELAELLDAPVTRLYHHVNRLEQLGLIRVVATRRVGAVTERRYQAVARSFKVDPAAFEQLDGAELAHIFGALYDVAKIAMQRYFESGEHHRVDLEEEGFMSLAELELTPERRRRLVARLREVVDEFSDDRSDAGAERTVLFVATHPDVR